MEEATEAGGSKTPDGSPGSRALGLDRARLARSLRYFAMELLIVTSGVLIALWVQQWAEERSWQQKARYANDALRTEVAVQYQWAIEWRVVESCVQAQIARLQQRLLRSGDRLDPAPVYSEPGFDRYVIRMPDRTYESGTWQATINDGVVSHLDPAVRRNLDSAYTTSRTLAELNAQNSASYQRLLGLSRPLLLDPGVRFTLLREKDELQGRVNFSGYVSGQSLDNWSKARVLPPPAVGRRALASSGTRLFCATHHLPMRSIRDAEKPVPND